MTCLSKLQVIADFWPGGSFPQIGYDLMPKAKANKIGGSTPGKQTTPTKKGAGPAAKKRSANGGGD